MKTYTFYSLAASFIVASLLLSSCVIPGVAPAATDTPIPTNTPAPTNTPEATATSTPKPTTTHTPTATPNLTATQQVEDFSAKIKEYYDAKYVSTTDGTYTPVKDFEKSWAQINWYQFYRIGLAPTDFVLKSDIAWKSASAAADSSGCGFVFREQPNGDDYMAFVSLKGFVEASYFLEDKSSYSISMGRGAFGNPAQNGKATLTLIVEGNIFRVLINDKLIKAFTGLQGKLTTGGLAYTVVSGTNKDYGTNCQFKNTELWTIQH